MEKINIAELLKVCPTDMELDCVINENVYFDKIIDDDNSIYPIRCYVIENGVRNSIYFTKYGEFYNTRTAKCVIFPKGKTTWEGFHRPFKDGDVLFVKAIYEHIFIFKDIENNQCINRYVNLSEDNLYTDDAVICNISSAKEFRFATEEEKKKLFQAIKDNGYKWNEKTKTLEKLAEPKFKVGDRIENRGWYRVTIAEVKDNYYLTKCGNKIPIDNQDDFSLVPNKFDINTLKPFDKVLVRDTNGQVWTADLFSHIIDTNPNLRTTFVCVGHYPNQCIPFNGNEHLLNTNNDCNDFYKNW